MPPAHPVPPAGVPTPLEFLATYKDDLWDLNGATKGDFVSRLLGIMATVDRNSRGGAISPAQYRDATLPPDVLADGYRVFAELDAHVQAKAAASDRLNGYMAFVPPAWDPTVDLPPNLMGVQLWKKYPPRDDDRPGPNNWNNVEWQKQCPTALHGRHQTYYEAWGILVTAIFDMTPQSFDSSDGAQKIGPDGHPGQPIFGRNSIKWPADLDHELFALMRAFFLWILRHNPSAIILCSGLGWKFFLEELTRENGIPMETVTLLVSRPDDYASRLLELYLSYEVSIIGHNSQIATFYLAHASSVTRGNRNNWEPYHRNGVARDVVGTPIAALNGIQVKAQSHRHFFKVTCGSTNGIAHNGPALDLYGAGKRIKFKGGSDEIEYRAMTRGQQIEREQQYLDERGVAQLTREQLVQMAAEADGAEERKRAEKEERARVRAEKEERERVVKEEREREWERLSREWDEGAEEREEKERERLEREEKKREKKERERLEREEKKREEKERREREREARERKPITRGPRRTGSEVQRAEDEKRMRVMRRRREKDDKETTLQRMRRDAELEQAADEYESMWGDDQSWREEVMRGRYFWNGGQEVD